MLTKHREMLEDQRRGLGSNGDQINKVAGKLDKARENLMNEIQLTRDEILIKIDHNDRFTIEQFQQVKEAANNDKQFANTAVERVREDLNAILKKELGAVQYLVTTMTSQATEHRETL